MSQATGQSQRQRDQQRLSQSAIVASGHTSTSITDSISAIVLTRRTPLGWFIGAGIAFALVLVLLYTICYVVLVGTGVWGLNVPVGWGFAIINFVWWIGIGHAGTLISAILLLLHQQWRTSINRFAEAMTLFAVACAGVFPLLHVGRPWPSTIGIKWFPRRGYSRDLMQFAPLGC